MASNFAALSCAEVACRATSILVTLELARRLGTSGFGRIEFAFNVVFWLVLIVRDGLELLGSREIARHPRLVRPLVNLVLSIRVSLGLALWLMLFVVSELAMGSGPDRFLLGLYGLLLLSTSLGLDFVFRGQERMGLIASSLLLRTSGYATAVLLLVQGPEHILLVPICLFLGESLGISLIWSAYVRRYGFPRPSFRAGRVLWVLLRRGRSVFIIQVSQTVIVSVDLLVVGLMSPWSDVGLYSASHRLVMAILTFGLIFQQVVFPSLARTWRDRPEAGRRALETLVGILVMALLPLAVGTSLLSKSLVHSLLQPEYARAGPILAIGVWRAPLLALGFLYQATLIAVNRERAGVRLLFTGALLSGPTVALFRWSLGLSGAAASGVLIAGLLMLAGHRLLAREGRHPTWHHRAGLPLVACLAMTPVCLLLVSHNVFIAVAAGASVYLGVLGLLGGLRLSELRQILGKPRYRDS